MGSKPSKPQYQAPQYTELSLPELRTALSKFIDQEQDFGGLQNAITSSATKRMDALETLQPGYKAGLSQAQQVADSLAGGNIPTDVAQKISQSAAFKGLMTGMSGQQRSTVEARDLGLTSLDLQSRGLAGQQALRAEANAQMPLQALNLAFTPQAIRAEDVGLAQYNNQIKNQQATASASTYNRQQDANYAYDSQYGGNPFGAIGGGILGAGLGLVASGGNPMGGMMGFGMGSRMGGFFGGGVGQGVGSAMSGIGFGGASLMSEMNGGAGPSYTPWFSNSGAVANPSPAFRSGGATYEGKSYNLFPQFGGIMP